MNEHAPGSRDDYADWLDAKRATPIPAGFSARVMDRVRSEAESTRTERRLSKPWLWAGAWAAASVVLLMRVGAVIGVFWPT